MAGGVSRRGSCERHQNLFRLSSLRRLAGAELGSRKSGAIHVSLSLDIVRPAVARTSERTYEYYFQIREPFRVSADLPVIRLAEAGVDSYVNSLLACGSSSLEATEFESKHNCWLRGGSKVFPLPRTHPSPDPPPPWVVDASEDVACFHAEAGTVPCKRRHIAWSVVQGGESLDHSWGPGEHVL